MNFQHHYSSLQCHMILQKSFKYVDLPLKKQFLLLSRLKEIFRNIINALTVTIECILAKICDSQIPQSLQINKCM